MLAVELDDTSPYRMLVPTEPGTLALADEPPTDRGPAQRIPIPSARGPHLSGPRRSALSEALDRLEDLAFSGDPRFEALGAVPSDLFLALPLPTQEALKKRLVELEREYWPRAIRRGLGACWDLLRHPRGLDIDTFAKRLATLERARVKARTVGLDRAVDSEELATLRTLKAELEWAHRLADVDEVDDPQPRRSLIEALDRRAASGRSEVDTAGSVQGRLSYLVGGGLDAWLRRRGCDLRLVPQPVATAARDLQRQTWCLQALVEAQARLFARTSRTVPGLALALASVVERITVAMRVAGTTLPVLEDFRVEAARLLKLSSPSGLEAWLRFPTR